MRVLIVDNQLRARQSMRALLNASHQFEEIREAENGDEAIKLLEEYQPDIILTDVRMPLMDGIQATKLIKDKWPWIKIIVLSLYPDYQIPALAAGADGFVSKSDSPEELRKTLAAVMQKE